MMRAGYYSFIAVLLLLTSFVAAAKTENKQGLGGSLSLGGAINTGNSDTKNLNGKLSFDVLRKQWYVDADVAGEFNHSKGETNTEKLSIETETRYLYSEKSYFFLRFSVYYDKFATFDIKLTESGGYGRILYKSDRTLLSAELGPGARQSRISGLKKYQDEFIINTNGFLVRKVGQSATFKQTVKVDWGYKNTHIKSITAIKTKMMEHLALEVSFTADHDTETPMGSKNRRRTETVSKVAVVYDF